MTEGREEDRWFLRAVGDDSEPKAEASRPDQTRDCYAELSRAVQELAEATRRVADINPDLRSDILFRDCRWRVHHWFGLLVRRARLVDQDQRLDLLEKGVERGDLTEEEADEIEVADIILTGRWKADGELVYIVAEVSAGVGVDDVKRAARRAGLLAKTGVRAVPVVAGERILPEAAAAAAADGVWQLTDGSAIPPAVSQAWATATAGPRQQLGIETKTLEMHDILK